MEGHPTRREAHPPPRHWNAVAIVQFITTSLPRLWNALSSPLPSSSSSSAPPRASHPPTFSSKPQIGDTAVTTAVEDTTDDEDVGSVSTGCSESPAPPDPVQVPASTLTKCKRGLTKVVLAKRPNTKLSEKAIGKQAVKDGIQLTPRRSVGARADHRSSHIFFYNFVSLFLYIVHEEPHKFNAEILNKTRFQW
jgi:hypothetical protein